VRNVEERWEEEESRKRLLEDGRMKKGGGVEVSCSGRKDEGSCITMKELEQRRGKERGGEQMRRQNEDMQGKKRGDGGK
jgi:hypothetical protein